MEIEARKERLGIFCIDFTLGMSSEVSTERGESGGKSFLSLFFWVYSLCNTFSLETGRLAEVCHTMATGEQESRECWRVGLAQQVPGDNPRTFVVHEVYEKALNISLCPQERKGPEYK